jgi:hypothetical protein
MEQSIALISMMTATLFTTTKKTPYLIPWKSYSGIGIGFYKLMTD